MGPSSYRQAAFWARRVEQRERSTLDWLCLASVVYLSPVSSGGMPQRLAWVSPRTSCFSSDLAACDLGRLLSIVKLQFSQARETVSHTTHVCIENGNIGTTCLRVFQGIRLRIPRIFRDQSVNLLSSLSLMDMYIQSR